MATQNELNVKFKVDASGVAKGTDEAKRKVKDAADSMASDVQSSAQKMQAGFADTGKSVQQLDTQIASSSRSMERNLDSVSKKISAMQIAAAGGRLLSIAGNAANWAGDNLATTDAGKQQWGIAGSALAGAGQGLAIGAQIGSFSGNPLIAGGAAALGAAAGALLGAGKELMGAASSLKEAAIKRGQELDDYLHNAVEGVRNREAAARVESETNAVYEKYTGMANGRNALEELITRQQAHINTLQGRYDAKVLEYAENEKNGYSLNNEQKEILDKRSATIDRATQLLQEYVEALRRIDEHDKSMEEGWDFGDEGVVDRVDPSWFDKSIELDKEQKKLDDGEATLADLQKRLTGIATSTVSTPSDALTRIGGGVGYASYNYSVEQVQRNISRDLKTLIQNQTRQNKDIADKLDDLKWQATPPTFQKA